MQGKIKNKEDFIRQNKDAWERKKSHNIESEVQQVERRIDIHYAVQICRLPKNFLITVFNSNYSTSKL